MTSYPDKKSPEWAVEVIENWLPPLGVTSIPEEPIKSKQANELHSALAVLRRLVLDLEPNLDKRPE